MYSLNLLVLQHITCEEGNNEEHYQDEKGP